MDRLSSFLSLLRIGLQTELAEWVEKKHTRQFYDSFMTKNYKIMANYGFSYNLKTIICLCF